MRILAIHNYYQIRSGEDIAFDSTVDSLRQRGHEVRVLCRDNRDFQGLRGLARVWSRLTLVFSTVFSIRAFAAVWHEVGVIKPDVALVQNVFPLLSPSVYWALRLRRVPVAQRVFNYRLVCPNGILYTQNRICERCSAGAYWNAVRYRCYRESRPASAVLAASIALARWTGVWHWGVTLYLTPDDFLGTKILPVVGAQGKIRKVMNPAPTDLQGAKTDSKIARNGNILYVGRLAKPKGLLTLVETASRLRDRSFDVIGRGEDEAQARKLAETTGASNIRWLGAIYGEELQSYLDRSGALILPSEWYDNMPLILTQALLSAIPVVASRINGIPEFIIDGVTGRLAEPRSPEQFALRLSEVFDRPDETRRMVAEGLSRSRQWFLPESSTAAMEAAFRELLPPG